MPRRIKQAENDKSEQESAASGQNMTRKAIPPVIPTAHFGKDARHVMIYAICNPTAGNGRARKIAQMVKARLDEGGIACEMLYTEFPGHATTLAAQARERRAETVLAIGGDGTNLEVARGLLGGETALGIIPAGTGNDFVKTLGIPSKPLEALEFLLAHPPRKTDVGECNGQLFLNVIGTGFDVSVLDYAAKAKKYCRGLLPYLYGVLKTLRHFRSIRLTYATDGGEEITQDAFVAAVANGSCFGGGIVIAPEAQANDGLLDLVVVGHIEKKHLMRRLFGLLKGQILSFPETTFARVTSVTFSCPGMRLNVDGEVSDEKGASARILPGALRIHW